MATFCSADTPIPMQMATKQPLPKANLTFGLYAATIRAINCGINHGPFGVQLLNDLKAAGNRNILLSGGTTSPPSSGDLGPEFPRGSMDYWLISFNPNSRQINWQHRYGGTGKIFRMHSPSPWMVTCGLAGNGLWRRRSGRPLRLAGPRMRRVTDGRRVQLPDVTGNKTTPLRGGVDYWLIELNKAGQPSLATIVRRRGRRCADRYQRF